MKPSNTTYTYTEPTDEALTTVEEPMAVYLSRPTPQPVIAWKVLGGHSLSAQVPGSGFAFFELGEKGITKASVLALTKILDIPMVEMADLLNISFKTFSRKKDNDLFDSWISSHAIEIAQTVARGLSLFEDEKKLQRWLKKPNRALHGKIPLALLKNATGLKLLNQVMGRIEEGIYT